jgi:hypothetical protein
VTGQLKSKENREKKETVQLQPLGVGEEAEAKTKAYLVITHWQPLLQDKPTGLTSFKSSVEIWCDSDSSCVVGHQ